MNYKKIAIAALLLLLCVCLFAACGTEPKLAASYDDTHEITEGDDIDELKPYLTVEYDDGRGQTRRLEQNEYELVGELKAGACVLTVRYLNLQATFTVNVNAKVVKGTRENPYSVKEAADEAQNMQDTYSAAPVYVRGKITGEIAHMMNYTFSIADEDGYTIKVINAVLRYSTWDQTLLTDDDVVVYGYLYNGAEIGLRSREGVQCEVVERIGKQEGVQVHLSADVYSLTVGECAQIRIETQPAGHESDVELTVIIGMSCGELDGSVFYATAAGEVVIRASLTVDGETYYSNQLTLNVTEPIAEKVTVTLKADRNLIEYSDNTFVYASVEPVAYESELTFEITAGREVAKLVGNSRTQRSVLPLDEGFVTIVAKVGNVVSDPVTIQIIRYDPYTNVGASGFYNRYTPAEDLEDSYWRTKHSLMSGDISEQDQEPTLSPNRPMSGNKFVRNTDENYADNGNSYKIVDWQGNVVNTVYKCGAYVTLEEVAAYVYAWGDVPANYRNDKSTNVGNSAWGKYLRLNNSYYSGDTDDYPYEPVMPEIYGRDGNKYYYEIDIGTTGTDCDPRYEAAPYNNGVRITRGAARIVYARYDGDNNLLEPNERYVFYTNNHYNDFREYLNYQGGWGEMFGNITGGGEISSDHYYNPTPYVEVARQSFGCH